MAKINKMAIVEAMAEKNETTKYEAEKLVDSFLEELKAQIIAGNEVQFRNFGTFLVRESQESVRHNPRTNKMSVVPACKRVKFKVSSKLLREVNE